MVSFYGLIIYYNLPYYCYFQRNYKIFKKNKLHLKINFKFLIKIFYNLSENSNKNINNKII
uniref:Uncharacterized protein n=1 Tax=viral metagenome TaxID=1070528 RepID=A0A6C0H7K7_9ZZZZ